MLLTDVVNKLKLIGEFEAADSLEKLPDQFKRRVGALEAIASDRKDALFSLQKELKAAEKERDELRAKLSEMEKQELVGVFAGRFEFVNGRGYIHVKCDGAIPEAGAKLYALPVPQQVSDEEGVPVFTCVYCEALYYDAKEDCQCLEVGQHKLYRRMIMHPDRSLPPITK